MAGRMSATDPTELPELSAHTRRAYAADWHAFAVWCAAVPATPLPAAPSTVARYLATLQGLGSSTVRRKLAAIADQQRRAGLAWNPRHPAIGAALQNLASTAAPRRPAAALRRSDIQLLLDTCGSDLAGMRDRALLLLATTTGLRRGQLVSIDREHFLFTPAGMTLRIGAEEQVVARSDDPGACPIRALEAWLRRTDISYGAVFRQVTAVGTLEGRLTAQGVWKILRRRAALAKLVVPPGFRLSPDGLRPSAANKPTPPARKPGQKRAARTRR